jgi:hypothetical protein
MLPSMSTLAEIENAAEKLSPAQQEELVRFLTSRLARQKTHPPRPYRMSTHPGGVLPGIDPGKLGQLPEDF